MGATWGIAFQLVDDAIDYDSDSAEMGKGRGDDFRDGKMTLPVILAYARGDESERAFWREAIGGARTGDADLAHAVMLIHATTRSARRATGRAISRSARWARSRRSPPMPRARRWRKRRNSRCRGGTKAGLAGECGRFAAAAAAAH